MRVLRGLGFPPLFVVSGRVAGCHNGPLLWSCGHFKLCPVAAAGVLLCWYVRRTFGFDGVIRVFLMEKKITIKSVMAWLAMRGRKMKFKNGIHICIRMCIRVYMCGNNKCNVTYI